MQHSRTGSPPHRAARWTAGLALLLALGVSASGATAQRAARAPGNPYDAEVRRLEREVTRLARSPRALLPLLEIWQKAEDASEGLVRGSLERLARERRLSPLVRAYAGRLVAIAKHQAGDVEGAERDVDGLGFVREWHVVGPFDNEGRAGFDRVMGPEGDLGTIFDAAAAYPGRERQVSWRRYPDIMRLGYVDLDAVLRPYVNVCGYAQTFVHSEGTAPVALFFGAGGAAKVFWNGDEVARDDVYRASADPDRAAAVVQPRDGWNRLLVKSCTAEGAWGFFLRLGRADGSPPAGLRVDPEGATEPAPAAAAAGRMPAVPVTALASLEAAVSSRDDDAQARYELARLLTWTGAEDPVQGRSRDLAQAAATLAPTVDRLLLAARTAENRAERMRYVAEAEGLDARHPEVRLFRAALVASGPDGDRALRLLEEIPPATVEGVRAAQLRANLLGGLGLSESSEALTRQVVARMASSETARYTERRLDEGGVDRDLELARGLLTRRADDFGIRRQLVSDALQRGDTETILAQLDAMLLAAPGDAETLYYAAGVQDALGDADEALSLHQRVIDLVPDEPRAHAAYGQALLRYGQRDAAAAALRTALALSPQDAGTRRLLEQIRPSERPDEAYATAIEPILERRRERSDWPATVLHDLTVNTVYENGLSSTFKQVVFQVHDDEGARRWTNYSVSFEPGSQWVDLRRARIYRADGGVVDSVQTWEQPLGDPAYRIYYDTRALVLSLPDLEPGDTVELRYRIEDVSRRNAFNDYYGDVAFLQRFEPIDHLEYVLLTPPARRFYFNEPTLSGLRHEQTVQGETRVDRFVADDIPAIRREEDMPGMTEIAPYLHVSTYQSWEDVGRWWWGLIQEQLHMDDSLRRTVDELTADAPDLETKVRRIYSWVIRNTRYVGLEFGIHGFKPYRVTQIVQRGFGDCKDKASLLYVMLRHAGIDARIALVRTRRNGAIPDLPASLAVFDHAIAYVPGLDRFLDGTAEMSGSTELPAMDQGVTVLLVGPDGAELRRTPVQTPADQRRERTVRATLAADGSATVEVDETVRGSAAGSYRTRYQSQEDREERLQRELAGTFPGVELTAQRFGDLDDFEEPVTFHYEARVPQLAQRTADTLRFAPTTVSGLLRGLAPTETRVHPLDLGTTTGFVEHRTVRLPRGARITDMPRGGEARSEFGRLAIRWEQSAGQVTATTELELSRDLVSPEDYPRFRRWVEEMDVLLRERVTLGGAQ